LLPIRPGHFLAFLLFPPSLAHSPVKSAHLLSPAMSVMSTAIAIPTHATVHGIPVPVRVHHSSLPIEMQLEVLNLIVDTKNRLPHDASNDDVLRMLAVQACRHTDDWFCSITVCYAGSPIPHVEITIDKTAYTVLRSPSSASLRLAKMESDAALRSANDRVRTAEAQSAVAVTKLATMDAALRAANERICVAEAQAASAVSELATAVADHKALETSLAASAVSNLASAAAEHKALEASLIKALGAAKSESAAALLLAEQYRLAKCKAIADHQHSEAQNQRALSRSTAQLNVISMAADDQRAKCRQADETIAALRSELKAQPAKAVIISAISSSKSVSPSPHVNLSRHLRMTSSVSMPILEASSSLSAYQASSAMPSPIPTAPFSTSSSSFSAIRSRIPCPLPTPLASASPSRRIASVSVASPIPAAISTTEQSPFPLLHCEQNQVYRIASMVCLMAKIAMLSSPSVPGHVLTVSMRGAVFEPIVVDVH
jgi:hypothetical protein